MHFPVAGAQDSTVHTPPPTPYAGAERCSDEGAAGAMRLPWTADSYSQPQHSRPAARSTQATA